MSDEVRTRFAPSPTGYLHLGGLRTALYTYLFAKKHGGKFILRIEDTDQEREVPGAVDLIYKSMRQAGLTYDEGPDVGGDYGPYIQTQRRDLYPKYAWELVEKGGAYCCFCTKEEIEADRKAAEAKGETYKYNKKCLHNVSLEEAKRRIAAGEPYVIRQNVPTTGKASFDDMLYGHVEVDCDTLDDNVLIKADGLPTYNFANVVDDHLMAHQPRHARHGIPLLRAEVQPALRGLRLEAADLSASAARHDRVRPQGQGDQAAHSRRKRQRAAHRPQALQALGRPVL